MDIQRPRSLCGTHNEHISSEKIRFTNVSPFGLKNLRRKNGKEIWICGGANLVQMKYGRRRR